MATGLIPTFRTRKFSDDETVVCLDSFAGALPNGREILVLKETRMRATSDAVRTWPAFFSKDGATEDELHAQREEIFRSRENAIATETDAAMRAEEKKRERPPIPVELQVVCTTAFSKRGRSYAEGTIYRRDDPAVTDPETRRYFATPQRPLA